MEEPYPGDIDDVVAMERVVVEGLAETPVCGAEFGFELPVDVIGMPVVRKVVAP